MNKTLTIAFCLLCSTLWNTQAATDLTYRFPTENDALLRDDGENFFMYCNRTFEGQHTKPWEAGQYGFVRNPYRNAQQQLMFSHLHEGIDIKPLNRDAQGEPTDVVHPVAPGRVVYTATGRSNYGRYVVVAHQIPEGVIYTLYAHLSSIQCVEGQYVGTGNALGVMGHTGAGLNRERAHCHVEIAFMINSAYDKMTGEKNIHGNYHGFNLIGFDISGLLKHCSSGNTASISSYIATIPEHYRIRVPWNGSMDFINRYPFIYKGNKESNPRSLDMSFSAEGVPLAIYPSEEKVSKPTVISCKPMPTLQQNCTANRIKNSSKDAALTASGKRYINQYLWLEPSRKTPSEPINQTPQSASAPAA